MKKGLRNASSIALVAALGLLSPRIASACSAAPTVPAAGAVLTVRRSGEGLVWDGRYFLDVSADADILSDIGLALAAPLPPGTTSNLPAITDANGRVIGVCAPRSVLDRDVLHVSFAEPPAAFDLGAPVAAGAAVQILVPSAAADVAIEPTGRAFVRHVGFLAPEAVGHGAREEARRMAERHGMPVENPIFVRGDDVAAAGLAGRIVDPRAQDRGSAAGVAVVFGAIVAALGLVAKRLRSRASVERADALLALEIESESAKEPAHAARERPE